MSEFQKLILSSAGFSALFSGAIIWLFKSWISERLKNAIEHEYAQKLETHKAQLKAQSDVEIEKLKSELQIAASERNIKLNSIFEKQADTVVKTYQMLVTQNQAIFQFVVMRGSNQPTPEEMEKLWVLRREFYDFFFLNKIYLPQATADKIKDFEMTQNLQQILFTNASRLPYTPEKGNEQIKIYEKLNKDIPEFLRLLEEDLQKILGFPIPDKTDKA